LITLDDVATNSLRRVDGARTAPVAASLLNGALFLTVLISPLVFIEPSPYEAAAALLGLACISARVTVDQKLLALIALLVLWNLGGLFAVMPVLDQDKTVQYAAVSLFLSFTAIMYACLFTHDIMRRLSLLQGAYIVAGTVAAMIGIIGYFEMFPGAGESFAKMDRAQATFKDPNVFGPFLIMPILLLAYPLLNDSIKLRHLLPLSIMLFGLLLSFSRGAWVHFAVSAASMVGLMLLTSTDLRARARLIVMVILAGAVFASLIVFALSFDAIGDMFEERAKLFQSYDAGTDRGRFYLQSLAIDAILQHPFGMGPLEFSREYGLQQHNVYLQAFLVYGWLGGLSYIILILLTLGIGFRTALAATPWQPFLIVALATFVGLAVEGAVIDTDHWRHFFLLLGCIWGLSVATMNARRLRWSAREASCAHAR
jgi:hypothetical protein